MKTKFFIPLAGLVLFCACKANHSADNSDSTSPAPLMKRVSTIKFDTGHIDQKLVKTADMRFKVKNVQQTSEKIAALTTSCNGSVIHHIINTTTADSTTIHKSDDSLLRITVINSTTEMTVRIPPARMEDFVNQVTAMGILINNMKVDINDKSLAYLADKLKLKNQGERVDNPGKSSRDPDNLLAQKNNLIDQRISNLKTDDSVKNSTIILSFYQSNVINKETIANPDLSAYNFSFSTRVFMAFKSGWHVFMEIIIALSYLWVLALISIFSWVVIRYYKNKKPTNVVKVE